MMVEKNNFFSLGVFDKTFSSNSVEESKIITDLKLQQRDIGRMFHNKGVHHDHVAHRQAKYCDDRSYETKNSPIPTTKL